MNDPARRLPSEIAHVLFMDLVGYSRCSMEEQARLARALRVLVRGTPEFQAAEARQELVCLDTGDGMALIFSRDPIAPVECAVEIARAGLAQPHIRLRIGIHSGPVSHVPDINGRDNLAGSGINMAQRIMDCGDAGNILLSQRSAEDLRQFQEWAPHLHDLGEVTVKHGERLRLFSLCTGEVGDPALPQRLRGGAAAWSPGRASAFRRETELALEAAGGAVPLDSPFYIDRGTDDDFKTAVARQDSIVLVKGPRQIGKTSLLARGLQQARVAGARIVLTDLQNLTAAQLESADMLFLTLAEALADQLDIVVTPEASWNHERSWNVNFERFLRREVLGTLSTPLVWALDEVDRLFNYPFGSEVFGLFRSWHNQRALNPEGPWGRLTLAMAYATEAHLFITDLNQSPFNVGTRLLLEDFTSKQVAEINCRYRMPLRDADSLERFYRLVGGHPYLVRRGLDEIAARGLDIKGFEAQAGQEEGIFGDHLRRLLRTLEQDGDLADTVRALLRGEAMPTSGNFYRLRSAGVLTGTSEQNARPRCGLYHRYLHEHLQ